MTRALPVLRPLVLVAAFPLTLLACLSAFGPSQDAPAVRPVAEARPPGERALDRPAARAECAEPVAGAAARTMAGRAPDEARAPSRADPGCGASARGPAGSARALTPP